jgi:hypothetical protein
MSEQTLDLWTERRGEIAVLVGKLQPDDALEVLKRVVTGCPNGSALAPMLIGTIRGMVEQRQAEQRWRSEGGRPGDKSGL